MNEPHRPMVCSFKLPHHPASGDGSYGEEGVSLQGWAFRGLIAAEGAEGCEGEGHVSLRSSGKAGAHLGLIGFRINADYKKQSLVWLIAQQSALMDYKIKLKEYRKTVAMILYRGREWALSCKKDSWLGSIFLFF